MTLALALMAPALLACTGYLLVPLLLASQAAFMALRSGREERLLEQAYGEGFAAYRAATPALLPRLQLWHGPAGLGSSDSLGRLAAMPGGHGGGEVKPLLVPARV